MTQQTNEQNQQIQINLPEIKKIKLFIAIPCYGGLMYENVHMSLQSWQQVALQLGIEWRMVTLTNESLITRGRNTLTAQFLESGYTHLMFIDADIGFTAEQILLLLHDSTLPEVKLVGGAYPMKSLPIRYVVNGIPGAVPRSDGLVEVAKTGTGFMLIKREVFDTVKLHPRVEQYNNDLGMDVKYDEHMYNFWDCAIVDKRYLSEDWLFCHMYRELGGQVWVDGRIKLTHTGTYTFSKDSEDALKITYGATK